MGRVGSAEREVSRGRGNRSRVVAAPALAVLLMACPAREVAREVTPPAVSQAIEEATTPESVGHISGFLADEAILASFEALAASITRGVVGALVGTGGAGDELSAVALAGDPGPIFQAAGEGGAGASPDRDGEDALVPGLERLTEAAMEGAISGALSPQSRRQAEQFAAAVARAGAQGAFSPESRAVAEEFAAAVSRASMQGVAEGIEQDLGPAIRALLVEELRPALDELAGDGTFEAPGQLARVMSREAVLGVNDALLIIQRSDEQTALAQLERLTRRGINIALIAAIALGVIVLALIALLLRMLQKAHAQREILTQREASTLLLAQAIKAAEAKPGAEEFAATLREELRDREGADYVRELLRKNGSRGPNGGSPR
jgi:hypothetical protein